MVNHCQTFLWRGEGLAENVDGDFLCECQLFWSSTNILGRPSCVPSKAHLIYGTVGLVSSTLGICHAAYQLKRQVSPKQRITQVTSGGRKGRVIAAANLRIHTLDGVSHDLNYAQGLPTHLCRGGYSHRVGVLLMLLVAVSSTPKFIKDSPL